MLEGLTSHSLSILTFYDFYCSSISIQTEGVKNFSAHKTITLMECYNLKTEIFAF